jgi:hypothetical protein
MPRLLVIRQSRRIRLRLGLPAGDVILISTTIAARTLVEALRFAHAVNVTRAKPRARKV